MDVKADFAAIYVLFTNQNEPGKDHRGSTASSITWYIFGDLAIYCAAGLRP